MSCTLKDVAFLAGVSPVTVSRVIKGARNVSCNTRTEVLSAISKLKYRPDVHAVKLRRGKGSVRRKRGILGLLTDGTGTEFRSDSGAKAQNERGAVEKMRLLEEENARLKRLIANLSMDVEMWRNIAE